MRHGIFFIFFAYCYNSELCADFSMFNLIIFSWEPDPVEADPLKGSRNHRKVDILGMIVGIIGSKEQLVNEYRVMLAEKLLNKSDYGIDSEIRTLELLKASQFFSNSSYIYKDGAVIMNVKLMQLWRGFYGYSDMLPSSYPMFTADSFWRE